MGRPSLLHDMLRELGINPDKIPCSAHCGPGWVPIIERLILDLRALGWDGDIHQIKSKFGGLRFYIGRTSHEIQARIAQAEAEAAAVCQACGCARPGCHCAPVR